MYVNVIARACRQRRKTTPRSLSYRQKEHRQDWLTSRGVKVYPEIGWAPPERFFFYKVVLLKKPLPKMGDTIKLSLVPALFVPGIGRTTYATGPKGEFKLTARFDSVRKVCALDGETWYDTVATITICDAQKLVLPDTYQGYLDYIPELWDHLRFVFSPNQRSSALLSHSRGTLGRTVKSFFPPYLHFDSCIQCQDKQYQIGYIVTDGPRFATIDHLQHPNTNIGQSFNYLIDKVVCAKNEQQLITVTQQSFRLKIEILSIQAEKSLIPDYCMVVGRIRDCSQPELYPNEPEFLAQEANESDTSLFQPGTYVYIDHYLDRKRQSKATSRNPYRNESEIAQICYIIGPGTPKFGSCPIRPFS